MDITGGDVLGVQEITPIKGKPTVKVMCDQEGWTVFQSRGDFGNPADYFFREWKDYQEGFGEAGAEHWMGLENLHHMTQNKQYRLRVRLTDNNGVDGIGYFLLFRIGDQVSFYKLEVGQYLGTLGSNGEDIGDSLGYHDGMSFTTIDADNDESSADCADQYQGAWWYKACVASGGGSSLNGLYGGSSNKGIIWTSWNLYYNTLPKSEMALKEIIG